MEFLYFKLSPSALVLPLDTTEKSLGFTPYHQVLMMDKIPKSALAEDEQATALDPACQACLSRAEQSEGPPP